MNEKFPLRLINAFRWKYATLVSVPSFIMLGARMLSGDFRPFIFIFLGVVILIAGFVGWISGRETIQYKQNGKWKSI